MRGFWGMGRARHTAHTGKRQAGIYCHKWRYYAAERLTLRPWPLPWPSRPGLLLLLLLLLPARCRRATWHDHVELGVGEEGPRARPAAVGERDAREAHAVQLDHVEPAGSAHAPDLPVPTFLEHEPQPRLPSAGLGLSRLVSAGLGWSRLISPPLQHGGGAWPRAGWAGEASRSTTQGRVRAVSGLARPSDWATVVMTTPAARRAMSASVAGTCVVTRYSFCFRSPARSSVLVRPPSEVSKMSPLLSLSRRPTGKRRSRTPSTSPSSSRMLPRTRRSVVQTTPRRFHILRYEKRARSPPAAPLAPLSGAQSTCTPSSVTTSPACRGSLEGI
mmetsp:Transcript_32992/g.110122  ORF Transcript_32992/g.110122 Transcript_32992/m.110122 type:complete len:331 (-) Transcript_32992:26-1018(-)